MKPYQILVGDCLQTLRTLPKKSVQCCITSPPYWSQRDYQTEGQLGQEPTPEEYIANLVKVFRAVRRVLRDDGTLWLNLGDKYENKQQLLIPHRVALALQADGWYLRDTVVWSKPNVMPLSVTDRTTTAHEYVFMLCKTSKYYYDNVAIQERGSGRSAGLRNYKYHGLKGHETKGGFLAVADVEWEIRNKRSVWTIATQPMSDAHFAAFPTKLVLPMILAGTSEKGCCPRCRAPYKRLVEKVRKTTRPAKDSKVRKIANAPGRGRIGRTSMLASTVGNRDPERHVTQTKTVGWTPTCDCNAGEPVPCIVLDCFSGSATTLAAALRRNRHAIGCELNPEYVKIGLRRINKALRKKGFGLI